MSELRQVADLAPGETIELARTPEGDISWPTPYRWSPHTEFVLGTVIDTTDGVLRILVDGRPYTCDYPYRANAHVRPAHHPVCDDCGELWPCRDERRREEAARFAAHLDDLCAHCGHPIGAAWRTQFSDGLTVRKYHLAQKYKANGMRCADAAELARKELPA